MMAWSIAQIGRCIAGCVSWFNQLFARIGGDNVLIFIFFIGAVIVLFIKPIIGTGITGSDRADKERSKSNSVK